MAGREGAGHGVSAEVLDLPGRGVVQGVRAGVAPVPVQVERSRGPSGCRRPRRGGWTTSTEACGASTPGAAATARLASPADSLGEVARRRGRRPGRPRRSSASAAAHLRPPSRRTRARRAGRRRRARRRRPGRAGSSCVTNSAASVERRPGDADVERRVQQLREGAVGLRPLEGQVVGRDPVARRRATSSSWTVPLAVVRWPMPSQSSMTVTPGACRSTHATCSGPSTSRWAEHGDPVGEERAGAVALLAVQPPAVTVAASAWSGCRARAWCRPPTARCRTACRRAPRRRRTPAGRACPGARSALT